MAKYKAYSYAQGAIIPVHFDHQIQPGTFEYTLSRLIDSELDLSIFDSRFNNDENGAPAFDPKLLLKIVLFAYSRGITSSRMIARACEENVPGSVVRIRLRFDCPRLRGERGIHGAVG